MRDSETGTSVTDVNLPNRRAPCAEVRCARRPQVPLLAGCATTLRRTRPIQPATNAQMIYDLSWPIFLIAGVVGVMVFAAIAYSVVRYRDRGQPIPEQTHGKPMARDRL